MTAGTIWPNTPDHPPLWWLAAELVAEAYDGSDLAPDDMDPRVWCAEQWPVLHAHWMERIAEYARQGPLTHD